MSYILHRHTKSDLPMAVGGDGPYVIDSTGKRYLDASGGAAVSCLGHSHPAVIKAIKDQVDKISYAHTGFFTNEPSEQLAEHLISRAPTGLAKVYFVSGGSEANETALKLARQYFLETGRPERYRFIARRQSYHGNTLGALAVGGNVWRREPYRPLLMEATHIAPCYAYRDQRADETEEAYGHRVADELETEILRLGPASVAGFIAEPVVGATAGVVPAVPGYLARVREICDRYEVLLILDEIMCGMGRTGTLFACEQDQVVPDILTCAKGLGAGYQPIGAVLFGEKIFDSIAGGSGAFQHGFTYIGHATACAAGLAVQRTLERDDLLHAVRERGRQLRDALTDRLGGHPHVGDIRGRGLFIGLELVQDRGAKTPFDPKLRLAGRIKTRAMENGLMCYPGSGTIDGARGDHVLLAPPFIIDERHVDEITGKLSDILMTVFSTLPAPVPA